MLQQFANYIKKEKLFNKTDKILLTVSGGVDSIVLCELFHQAKISFAIAHCNFQLRGKESDEDEIFVKQLAKKYNAFFYCQKFDTLNFSKKEKISIQMAARELRYEWFEKIRKNEKFNLIATAHHKSDSIETFFINMVRGTGIAGLHGILPKQGKIVRPLLFATKNEIELFAKKQKLKYREDSSNASDKYFRNKIRHHIIPILKELNPAIENTINNEIERLKEIELLVKNVIAEKQKTVFTNSKNQITISIDALKKLNPISIFLFEFLKPFHFNSTTVEEIIHSLNTESGKQFFSETHRLVKDRDVLIIEKFNLKESIENFNFKIDKQTKSIKTDTAKLNFRIKKNNLKLEIPTSPSIAVLDFDKLKFPLIIRKWQKGDYFQPLGMKGKKKLSDFFIDRKLSLIEKENTWVITSENKIIWIVGHRIDDKYKVTNKTSKIYFAKLV